MNASTNTAGKIKSIFGISLVLSVLVINQFTLPIFFPEKVGQSLGTLNKIVLLLFNIACIASGLYIHFKKPKFQFKTFLQILLMILICLVFMEAATRVHLFGIKGLSYSHLNSTNPIGESGFIQASKHPGLIYELKPNLDTLHKMVPFKTNSQGLRDKEYTVEKPENTFRAVVLGDSFTMPAGVAIEDAYHSLIESQLNKDQSKIKYEFINFGIGGHDPLQYIITLQQKALKYNPDLVMFSLCGPVEGFFTNDERNSKYQVKPKGNQFAKSYLLSQCQHVMKTLKKRARKTSKIYINPKYQYNLDQTEESFKKLQEFKKQSSVPVCIVILQHVNDREDQRKTVLELAKKYDLPTIITGPAFENTNLKELIIYKTDTHPNAKANKIFADVILKELKEKNLIEINKESDNE